MLYKQQKLLQLLVGNDGKLASQKSLRQLILDAGYSESIADNPKKIFDSTSWQEITESVEWGRILEKLVENALQERSIHGSNEAIDKLLKIKGAYAPKKIQVIDEGENMSEYDLATKILKIQIENEKRLGNLRLSELYGETLKEYQRVHIAENTHLNV